MKRKVIILGLFFVILIGIKSATYVVYEDEIAVVKNLGKVVAVVINAEDEELIVNNISLSNKQDSIKVIDTKGLKFKIPFVQDVEKYTSKNLTYKSSTEIINTKDDKKIEISMYAQYRIIDPLKFKLTVGSKENVRAKMDNRVYPVVIQSANNLAFHEFFEIDTLEKMIVDKKLELNKELIKDFGIFVTDIGINRKNFPSSNISSIEQKMSMQIEKESEKLIAEGDSIYTQEKAKTDRKRKEVIAKATEEAANIKAEADTQALKIYQESLKKDIEFYKFIQRMDVYKTIRDKTIFLDKNNSLLENINR